MLAALVLAAALTQPTYPAAAATEPLVCRYEAVAGTRIPERVCLTHADWATLKAAADARRAHNRPVIDNRRPGRGIGRW